MDDHWFEPLAAHMKRAYLRYSFTRGTSQEVDFIVEQLGLVAGMRVLDVGCGPGRHAHQLASRGIAVHGVDIAQDFIDIAVASAPRGATFERLDARRMPFAEEFDAVICLCQGAFGLMTADGDDETVIANIVRAVRPTGRVALSAFNAYFVVKYFEDAHFDAETGISHEHTEIRDDSGVAVAAELWTGCYTPRELRLLAAAHGLSVESISSVQPGAYGLDRPTLESPEFLLLATRD